jgi:hypothetical protein
MSADPIGHRGHKVAAVRENIISETVLIIVSYEPYMSISVNAVLGGKNFIPVI